MFFLAAFIASSVGAYLLYPSRAPVRLPGEILMQARDGINAIDLFAYPAVDDTTREIQMSVEAADAGPGEAAFGVSDVDLAIIFLDRSTRVSCLPDRSCAQSFSSDEMEVPGAVFRFNWTEPPAVTGLYTATATFRARAENGVAFAGNGVELKGQLPALEPNSYDADNPPRLSATYVVADREDYDWVGVPDFSTIGNIGIQFTRAQSVQDSASPFRVSNPVEQQSDTNRTFLAGALIGVAGGALVSALQELLHVVQGGRKSSPPPQLKTP